MDAINLILDYILFFIYFEYSKITNSHEVVTSVRPRVPVCAYTIFLANKKDNS